MPLALGLPVPLNAEEEKEGEGVMEALPMGVREGVAVEFPPMGVGSEEARRWTKGWAAHSQRWRHK